MSLTGKGIYKQNLISDNHRLIFLLKLSKKSIFMKILEYLEKQDI